MRNGLDLEQTGYRSVDELGDPLDRQDGAHAHQLVAGDADLVSCLHGRVGVADLAGVGAVGQPEEEPEAHDGEPIDAAIPGLTIEELAHYGWLIGGLLDGAFRLASLECSEFSAVPDAIHEARELFDELVARLAPEGER